MKKLQQIFLTFFYSGLLPKAPGTYGTLLGAVFGLLLLKNIPLSTFTLLTVALTLFSIKVIDKEERESGIHDSSYIVIDEVVGIWIAFIISSSSVVQIVLSVIFFRIYDIWKPSIIGKIDRDVKGGWGVMGDDIIAGIFAGLSSSIVYGALIKMGILL